MNNIKITKTTKENLPAILDVQKKAFPGGGQNLSFKILAPVRQKAGRGFAGPASGTLTSLENYRKLYQQPIERVGKRHYGAFQIMFHSFNLKDKLKFLFILGKG